MKNLNVSPAVAAELLRRRRQALIERFDTGLREGALRLKGCRFDALDEATKELVTAQVLKTLTDSEVDNVVVFLEQMILGEVPTRMGGQLDRHG